MMKSANIYKLIKHCYFIGVAIIAVAFAKPDLNAQSGFAKAIPIATNVNIDDILFHNDQLILRGNIANKANISKRKVVARKCCKFYSLEFFFV